MSFGFFISCDRNDDDNQSNQSDYLIFGQFYGFCMGETCIETFKLTEQHLYEDTLDDYFAENQMFVRMSDDKFEQVKDLMDDFPNELLNDNESVFGCPDCADGGGLYIEYSKNGVVKSWRIDKRKADVPEYLHDFMDQVNNKISLINN